MSTTSTDDTVGTLLAVEPGDHLDLTASYYDYGSALSVTDASEATTWDCQQGEDFHTREVRVESSRGATYVIVVGERRDEPATVYSVTDGESDERKGFVEAAAKADPDSAEVWCGQCGYGPNSPRAIKIHHGNSGDHDGEAVLVSEAPTEAPTEADQTVHDAVDEHDYLADVADALDVSIDEARTAVFEIGRYGDVREGRAYGRTD